jgi:hypothetical protein
VERYLYFRSGTDRLKSQHEEVITSPPEILSPPAETHGEPHVAGAAEIEIVQRILRADIRYLLSKFYLYYAMLPMREGLREQLTKRAFWWTVGILVIIGILALASLGGLKIFASDKFSQVFDVTAVFGITVASVACAGIVGGCVSMLQRIQSAPTEGDALFNLAALTNGWRGLSLSPLYGAIFASLLFVLFAAGILKGTVFPKIETVGSEQLNQQLRPRRRLLIQMRHQLRLLFPLPAQLQQLVFSRSKIFSRRRGRRMASHSHSS